MKKEKKKHYSTLLKEQISKLESDIYKILDGDVIVANEYKMKREIKVAFEKSVWQGETSKYLGTHVGLISLFKNVE